MIEFIKLVTFWFILWSCIGLLYSVLFNKKFTYLVVWYDGWVGYYWDKKNRTLYLFPIPYVGYKITMGSPFELKFEIEKK